MFQQASTAEMWQYALNMQSGPIREGVDYISCNGAYVC